MIACIQIGRSTLQGPVVWQKLEKGRTIVAIRRPGGQLVQGPKLPSKWK